MRTLSDALLEIDELNKRIDALESGKLTEEEAPKEYQRWKPEESGDYWYVTTDGGVSTVTFCKDTYDYACYNIGNVYKTEKEATRARDKKLALVELQDLAEGYKFDADADGGGGRNYFIDCLVSTKEFGEQYTMGYASQGTIYFKSQEAAQNAIEKLGEEKLKLIFGVE